MQPMHEGVFQLANDGITMLAGIRIGLGLSQGHIIMILIGAFVLFYFSDWLLYSKGILRL